MSESFNEAVLRWMQTEEPQRKAARIVRVTGDGTDWAGGTEEGFYSEHSVWIRYVDEAGTERDWEVTGSSMASLWDHVIAAWPA